MLAPTLSIIIITLNEQNQLPRLLGDLANQSTQDFEIIHVDSNSSDNTLAVSWAWAHRFARYQVIPMTRRGVSLGRNTGANKARGERLLFLDADTRLSSDFLACALSDLKIRRLDLGIVPMSAKGLSWRHKTGYAAFNVGIRITAWFFPTAIGACLFSTPELHRKIDGFDEALTLCEDCNYALKATQMDQTRLGVLTSRFAFNPRRLDRDGLLHMGLLYLRANLRRFFYGELYTNEIPYRFGYANKTTLIK
ncbi:glycosyltransferase [Aliiroseovarius sp. KMU-50]|uniref:Glycosyltransferase n=1 Tax=Aliiroseovarius salicola TaxID=3009082 RepID=A0ABT4W1D0_9RHOB|nr:glycosyltransferase [Aliiroseovarius sp. KMU-50]MDA5094320.1 glycosyltransferase [Aliiroseovarius sp. KMU-50]